MKTENKFQNLSKKRIKNADKDRRLFRMVAILNRLQDGKVFVRRLAEEFNVSLRTVQRDLNIIATAGFHLDQEGKGVYKFAPGVNLKKLDISNEQLSALLVLAEISKNLGGEINKSFIQLFNKVVPSDPWQDRIVPLMPRLINAKKMPHIAEIKTAMEEEKKIEIYYRSAGRPLPVRRKVCPLKILFEGGFNYLLTMFEDNEKKRFPRYRIDKIESVKILESGFRTPENIDEFTRKARNIWGATQEKHRNIAVVLKIKNWSKDYFYYQEIVGGQKLRKDKDGNLIFKATICLSPEIISHIMRNLPNVEVIKPQKLKDEIKSWIEDYLRNNK